MTPDGHLEHMSLREAAAERRGAAIALRDTTGDARLLGQLDIAIRLFDDVATLFLAHVDPDRAQPNDGVWLMAADAYFRAACVFLDGIHADVQGHRDHTRADVPSAT